MAEQYAMHVRGKTSNLTVNEALEYQFKRNEERATKWTDEQIASWMASEFPVSVATDAAEIARRRRYYNNGQNVWAKRGAAGPYADRPISHQYDENGQEVVDTAPVRHVTVTKTTVVGVSEEKVQEIVVNEVSAAEKRIVEQLKNDRPTINIIIPNKPAVTIPGGTYHKMFKKVLTKVKAGVPILLVGPAGTGKTKLASQIAEALSRPFTFNSFSGGTKESDLLGRTLPDEKGNWSYVPSPFVTSFTNGGVHLLDEMDAADSNLLVQINAAIANGKLSIPFSGNPLPFERHQENVIIGAANTYGTGADRMYVGRNQLDAATLNRFTMGTITVDYDQDLERNIATAYFTAADMNPANALPVLNWAWAVRKAIQENRMRRIMSTRNIEDCCKCLVTGDETLADLKADYFSGWTDDERSKVASLAC